MAVVVVRPLVGIMPGHLAEAKRALAAQGRPAVDDDALSAFLWTARALPVALDALAAQGAGVPLAEAQLLDARLQRLAADDPGPLAAVAVLEDGALVVEVRVVAADALAAADPKDAPALLVVRFGLAVRDGSAVHIQRFVVGRS